MEIVKSKDGNDEYDYYVIRYFDNFLFEVPKEKATNFEIKYYKDGKIIKAGSGFVSHESEESNDNNTNKM